MLSITATELKENLGKYLSLMQEEDVIIRKNGKIIGKLTSQRDDNFVSLKSLKGFLKGSNLTLDDARMEILKR